MDARPGLDHDGAVRDGPALRDAEEIARREHKDERDAVEARARYRAEGLPRLEPDNLVADRLDRDELLVGVRPAALLHRHPLNDGEPMPGRLYLTTRRIVLLGHRPLELDLETIEEVALVGGRLLVTLRDATGLTIEAARPRLLQVQIAAALAAARA